MVPHSSHLVTRRVMLLALKLEKLVNRRDDSGIGAADADFPTPRPIEHFITDGIATRSHDRGPGNRLRMHRERLREIPRAECGRNVAHVRANGLDADGIGRVIAIEEHAPTVRQIFEDVRRCVLIDTHDMLTALLHRCELAVVFSCATSNKTKHEEERETLNLHRTALSSRYPSRIHNIHSDTLISRPMTGWTSATRVDVRYTSGP